MATLEEIEAEIARRRQPSPVAPVQPAIQQIPPQVVPQAIPPVAAPITAIQPAIKQPPTLANIEAEIARRQAPSEAVQPDFIGAGIIEPARAIISGLTRTIGGGLAGAAQAISPFAEPGAGAATAEAIQAGTFQPTTIAGQENLETLGTLIEKGIDLVNIPISGVVGILELVSGQGIDQAVDTIKAIQAQGVSKTVGERIFEETGSPLAATIAETAPTAVAELLGLKGAGVAVGAAGRAGRATSEAVSTLAEVTRGIPKGIFQFQTPTKQRIARLIEEGSTDAETARFKLDVPSEAKFQLDDPEVGIRPEMPPRTKIQEFLNIGGPRVKTDRPAVNAINQGFDEGVIAAVKGASDADKAKMLKMVDIMERGKKNKRFAITNRPGDIAGDSLMERFRIVSNANRAAGKELDSVANALKGQGVDHTSAINSFVDDLDSMGVTLTNDLKPKFAGSDIEGVTAAERIISQVINRMKFTKIPDANDLHRLKRFIDEQVTFGKKAEGLAGKTEFILKNLRRNLDGILDTNFPEYNRVNTTFSETIGAIDAIQDVAGKKMNLLGPNADKATGTLLRRLMSNAQSRVTLLDAVNQLEEVATKHIRKPTGKELVVPSRELIPFEPGVTPFAAKAERVGFDDDLLTQILFVDELDSVFGPVARTSFQGQIDQAIRQAAPVVTQAGAIDIGVRVLGRVAEKVRGVNEEGAFQAIKELLRQP